MSTAASESATSPESIVVLITKTSKEAKLGIGLTTREGRVIVNSITEWSPFSGTVLKVGMTVKTINGTECTTSTQAVALLKAAEGGPVKIMAFNAKSGSEPNTFKKLVTEEFGREFNIHWKNNGRSCTIEHKNNPDDLTACCCPRMTQQYVYTLTLLDGGRVDVKDDVSGTFNRMQGGMAAGNGNPTQVYGVANMSGHVMQKAGRIENRLMVQEHMSAVPLATAVPAPAPQAESMARENDEKKSVADEIAKLKALLDDGVMTNEEFQEAKKRAIERM